MSIQYSLKAAWVFRGILRSVPQVGPSRSVLLETRTGINAQGRGAAKGNFMGQLHGDVSTDVSEGCA